jgi:chromosome segregation ATPase
LEKQEERKDLEAEITVSEERLKKERDKSRKVDEQLAQIVSRLQSIQENQQILRDQLLEQEKKHYRSQAENQGIIERLAVVDIEKDHDKEEVSQLQTELSQSERELEALEERKEEAEEDLAEAQRQRQEQENIVDSLQEKATTQQVSTGVGWCACGEKRGSPLEPPEAGRVYC